ncbi:MAG: hypothetical protein WC872_04460 [Candidatus Absconditabacterales bacterium]|jgi:hypothetical protein
MKNFLIIVIGLFCFANISAQNDEFKVKENRDIVILKAEPSVGKTDPILIKKYGEAKIIKAWQNGNFEFNEKTSLTYNFYGTKKKKNTTKTFLQRNGNEVIETTETKTGESLLAYETFLFWILASIGAFICINQWEKTKKEIKENVIKKNINSFGIGIINLSIFLVIYCIIFSLFGVVFAVIFVLFDASAIIKGFMICGYSVFGWFVSLLIFAVVAVVEGNHTWYCYDYGKYKPKDSAFCIISEIALKKLYFEKSIFFLFIPYGIGWFIGIGLCTGQWMPLIIISILIMFFSFYYKIITAEEEKKKK